MKQALEQKKQVEWHKQWQMFDREAQFLFEDWIKPLTLEDFRGKSVLECGCGGGMHSSLIAPYAKELVAVDLNTTDIARERNKQFSNITFIEGDLATIDLGRKFDIVFSVGVVHHTDDPERTFQNLLRHVKPGGKILVWVYSKEGNGLVEYGVEPVRKAFLRHLSNDALFYVSGVITAALYLPVYTVYRSPLKFLPFYEYFENFRKLSFRRNLSNVFDKLNAPQVQFISLDRIKNWFQDPKFYKTEINAYRGVSWTGFGICCDTPS
jgi:SAM-dependent methyltransferase